MVPWWETALTTYNDPIFCLSTVTGKKIRDFEQNFMVFNVHFHIPLTLFHKWDHEETNDSS